MTQARPSSFRRSWARQSSGALANRPKSGDTGYIQGPMLAHSAHSEPNRLLVGLVNCLEQIFYRLEFFLAGQGLFE